MIKDNLVSNAIKYNKIDGDIFFNWEADTKTLSVIDEGIGIDTHQLPLLFNRFFRADDSRSSQNPRNGSGLSVAQRLCDTETLSFH